MTYRYVEPDILQKNDIVKDSLGLMKQKEMMVSNLIFRRAMARLKPIGALLVCLVPDIFIQTKLKLIHGTTIHTPKYGIQM